MSHLKRVHLKNVCLKNVLSKICPSKKRRGPAKSNVWNIWEPWEVKKFHEKYLNFLQFWSQVRSRNVENVSSFETTRDKLGS